MIPILRFQFNSSTQAILVYNFLSFHTVFLSFLISAAFSSAFPISICCVLLNSCFTVPLSTLYSHISINDHWTLLSFPSMNLLHSHSVSSIFPNISLYLLSYNHHLHHLNPRQDAYFISHHYILFFILFLIFDNDMDFACTWLLSGLF